MASHSIRVPTINLKTLLEQPTPTIDLRLNLYETSTTGFLKALTTYKNKHIATVSERRRDCTAEKKKLEEKCKNVEEETNRCKIREIALAEGTP
jgi:kinetochore protein Spc25, fungi type